MYSIIVFTREELKKRFKELEEKHGVTTEMIFSFLHFPKQHFHKNNIDPKNLKVSTYTKIFEALFDAEKNPEKYKIFTENSSNIIENQKPENAEMSFIDSIIAGIPNVETEENETENNTKIFEKILKAEGEKPLNPKSIKMEVEDFKFFTGTFGWVNKEENSKEGIEEKEEIIAEKEEWKKVSERILVEDFLPPKPDISISIDTKDIEILQKFSKQIILMETKIARWKPSKYSLANIRDEYNIFVKKLEKKYDQNLSEYYILKNIYDDITMEYYFPDNTGTKKIINLLAGRFISQKNLQELNPDFSKNFPIKTPIETPPKPIVTDISPEIISPRTGKKIVIKWKAEPKKKKKEGITIEPQNHFAAIKQCADMLKYEIEENNIREISSSLLELFHTRLAKIESETEQDLSEYYIKKDHTNILTGELVYPSARDAMSKIYTCAWYIYVNKI